MLLGAIPLNQKYGEWIEIISKQRNVFKNKLKNYNNMKKLAGDPLGGVGSTSTVGLTLYRMVGIPFSRTMNSKSL